MCDHILFHNLVFSVSKTDSNISVGLQLFEFVVFNLTYFKEQTYY